MPFRIFHVVELVAGPEAREAAASTRASEMVAARIIFAAAISGLGPRFERVAKQDTKKHPTPIFVYRTDSTGG